MTKLQVKLKLSNCLIVFQTGFLPFYLDFTSFYLPLFYLFYRFHQVSTFLPSSFLPDFIKLMAVGCNKLMAVGCNLQTLWTDIQRPSQNDTKTLQGSPGIPGAKRHEIVSNFLEPPRFPQPCLRQKCVRP